MAEKIHANCGGCGRSFDFLPDKAKEKCLYCGTALTFPEGFELPDPGLAKKQTALKAKATTRRGLITAACPVCDRPKKYDGALAGRSKLCMFCSCPLIVPEEDGPASFAWKPEELAENLVIPDTVKDSVASHSRLAVNVLEKVFEAGKLGKATAEWVPLILEKLREWEQSRISRDSPLNVAFTAEILGASVFAGLNSVEIHVGSAALRLQIEIGSNRGINPAISSILSPGVNLAPKGGTRVIGLGGGRGDRDWEDSAEELIHLNVHLTGDELGTDFTYSIEDSEGNLIKSGEVMSHEFLSGLPAKLASGARSLLALKSVYGVDLPGHVLQYVSREGVAGHLERLTGDEGFARDIADRLQQLLQV